MEVRDMSKIRNWNKNNIDLAQGELEELISSSNADRKLYGIIRAMLWAIGYILEWIERHDK